MSERPGVNEMNRAVIEEFRTNHGKTTGRFAGSNLLLLTTTGAKTGLTRVNPMMYLMDGNRYVVFASHNAAPTSPDWYHNLVAHPDVTVEVGDERFPARAQVAQGEERRRIWEAAAVAHPFLNDHQARTRRQIPVVILDRQA